MTRVVTGNVEDGTTLAMSAYEEEEHCERKQEQEYTNTFLNKNENDNCKRNNNSRSSKREDSAVVDIEDYDNGDKYEAGEEEGGNIDDEDDSHSCIDESTVLANMTRIKDKQTKWQRWFGLHKMSKSQQRTCLILSLCIICGLLLFIFIGITFIVLNALNHSKDLQNANTEDSIGAEWNDIMIKAIVNCRAVLDTFHAYVQSLMSEMPLTNETVTTELIEETTNVVMKRFDIVSGLVMSTIVYASEVQIAPRGILTIIQPPDPVMYYQSMFNESSTYFAIPPTPWEIYTKGTLAYIGPYKPNAGNEDDIWSLLLSQPVFNTSDVHNHSNSSFWGFVNLYLNVSMVFTQNKLTEYMKLYNVDYMFVSYGINNTNVPVATSLPTPLTEEDINEFIETSHSSGQFHKEVNFTLYVKSRNTHHYLDATNVSCVIAISFFLVCVVFFIGVWLILDWTKEYDGRVHAPKMPPFALLTIGSSHAEELWNLVPMAMAETMDRLNHLQDTYMSQCKAYKINQLHPYTTSFVLRSMESAIAMGFAILATLQEQHESNVNYSHVHFGSKSVSSDNNNNINGKDNKPITNIHNKKCNKVKSNETEHVDAPLRELLGEEDGVLLLTITIHWCTDAYVSVEMEGIQDPITLTYCYDGKDIKIASAMSSYAASNTLTLSLEALSQVQGNVKLSQLTAAPHSQFMRVDRKGEKLPLFLLTDPSSQYLVNAWNIATKRESVNYNQRLSLLSLSKYKHKNNKEKSEKHHHHHHHHKHKQKRHGDANPTRNKNYLCSVEGTAYASEVSSLPIPIISSSSEHEQTSSSEYWSSSESIQESSSSSEFTFHHNPHTHRRRRVSNNYSSSTTSTTRTTSTSSSLSSFTSKSRSSHSVSHSSSFSSSTSTTTSSSTSSCTTTTTTSASASNSSNSLSAPRGNNANANTSLSAEHNPLDYYVGHLRTQPPPPPQKSEEVLLEPEEEQQPNNKDIKHENHNGEETEMKNCSEKKKNKNNTSLQRHSTHVTSDLLDVESINFKKEQEDDNKDELPVPHLYSQSTTLTAETLNSPSSANASEQTPVLKSEIVNEKKRNKDSQMETKNNSEETIIKYHKNEINDNKDENMQNYTVNSEESNNPPQNTDTVTTQIYREVVINNKNKNNVDNDKKTNQEIRHERLQSIEHVKSKKKKHKSIKKSKLHHKHQYHKKDKRRELIKQIKSKKVKQECLIPEADALTYSLIHPSINKAINSFLRHAFEHQSIAMEISYESVRVMVYYFYCSFKLLFRPLAVPERNNLYRRFIAAFGVPMKGILYHLAARCTIRYLQQQQEQNDMHYALRPPHYTVSKAFSSSASMSKSDGHHHYVNNNDNDADSKVVNKSISQ